MTPPTSPPDPIKPGRPRSDEARERVLRAVDDLLVEVGYAELTMKGVAQRAGVGRQTVYRWWSSPAEILLDACIDDAREQLCSPARAEPSDDLRTYLRTLRRFLSVEPAGLAYLALIGAAQHDPAVRELVGRADVLEPTAHAVLARVAPATPHQPDRRLATAQLVGPVLSQALLGEPLTPRQLSAHVDGLLRSWGAGGGAD